MHQVWEKAASAGGVATSFDLSDGRFINDGVQGGSPAYRNTAMLLKEHGLATAPVKFTVSFGQGESCWGNTFESDVTRRLASDVRRFGSVLQWVSRFEPFFVFVPINLLLKVLNFSAEFRNLMVRRRSSVDIRRAKRNLPSCKFAHRRIVIRLTTTPERCACTRQLR